LYKYRLGAVVLKDGKIVSKGCNRIAVYSDLCLRGYFSTHAECLALRRSKKGDTLIVVRILRDGSLACARPCDKCFKTAKHKGIRKIIYSDHNGQMKEIKI
jgi:tRNA(Arg) A34 adenosine deaminase TadA